MRVILTVLVALVWIGVAPALAAPVEPVSPVPPAATSVPPQAQANSRIANGLLAKLDGAAPSDNFPVIVTMAPGRGVAAAQSAVGAFSVKRRFNIINGFAATMTRAQIEALSRSPAALRIEEDGEVRAFLSDAIPAFGVDRVHSGVPPVTARTGTDTTICVVDTGIDSDHADFLVDGTSKVVAFCDATVGNGCGAADPGTTPPYDDHGHGTHVASIAAGNLGVAPGASLIGAKVLDADGTGADSDVIAGIEWCADRGDVDVISMSLGSMNSSDGLDAGSAAVDAAVDLGKVLVLAAGNEGPGQYQIGDLAAAEKAITVAAVADYRSPDAGWRKGLAVFSSRGPIADGAPPRPDNGIKPDISAPGVDIEAAQANTVDGHVSFSGTSMATPFVSGTVALMLEAAPGLSPAQVKNIIRDTAVQRGDASTSDLSGHPKNIDFGWGLVDPYAAVATASGVIGDAAYAATPFPLQIYAKPTILDGTDYELTFTVDGSNDDVPISVNIFSGGTWKCNWTFVIFGWDCTDISTGADFDAELWSPNNQLVDESTCEGDLDTQCGIDPFFAIGAQPRQETLLAEPSAFGGGTLPHGTWRVRVYPWLGTADDGVPSESADVIVTMGPLGGTPPPPPAPEGTISGTVTDGATTLAIAGASVTVGAAGSTTTDASGHYSLTVPPGDYTLTASAVGYIAQNRAVTVNDGDSLTHDFSLSPNAPPPATGSIAGTVTEQGTTNPIAGATVQADSGQSTTTAANGSYTLANVPVGSRTVTASASGYDSSGPLPAEVTDGGTAALDIALTASAGPLTADFTWSQASPPLGDIVLTASPADGSQYTWNVVNWPGGPKHEPTLIPAGPTATLQPVKTGDVAVSLEILKGGETASIVKTIAVGSTAPPPATFGSVTGTVTAASDGTPIAGAAVSADTGQSTLTNSVGSYSLANVPTGTRTITASATGFTTAMQNASVTDGGTAVVDFALSAVPSGGGVNATLTPSSTNDGKTWTATVNVALTDEGGPVLNTSVIGNWGADGGAVNCNTGATGQCAVSLSNVPKKTASVQFNLTSPVSDSVTVLKP